MKGGMMAGHAMGQMVEQGVAPGHSLLADVSPPAAGMPEPGTPSPSPAAGPLSLVPASPDGGYVPWEDAAHDVGGMDTSSPPPQIDEAPSRPWYACLSPRGCAAPPPEQADVPSPADYSSSILGAAQRRDGSTGYLIAGPGDAAGVSTSSEVESLLKMAVTRISAQDEEPSDVELFLKAEMARILATPSEEMRVALSALDTAQAKVSRWRGNWQGLAALKSQEEFARQQYNAARAKAHNEARDVATAAWDVLGSEGKAHWKAEEDKERAKFDQLHVKMVGINTQTIAKIVQKTLLTLKMQARAGATGWDREHSGFIIHSEGGEGRFDGMQEDEEKFKEEVIKWFGEKENEILSDIYEKQKEARPADDPIITGPILDLMKTYAPPGSPKSTDGTLKAIVAKAIEGREELSPNELLRLRVAAEDNLVQGSPGLDDVIKAWYKSCEVRRCKVPQGAAAQLKENRRWEDTTKKDQAALQVGEMRAVLSVPIESLIHKIEAGVRLPFDEQYALAHELAEVAGIDIEGPLDLQDLREFYDQQVELRPDHPILTTPILDLIKDGKHFPPPRKGLRNIFNEALANPGEVLPPNELLKLRVAAEDNFVPENPELENFIKSWYKSCELRRCKAPQGAAAQLKENRRYINGEALKKLRQTTEADYADPPPDEEETEEQRTKRLAAKEAEMARLAAAGADGLSIWEEDPVDPVSIQLIMDKIGDGVRVSFDEQYILAHELAQRAGIVIDGGLPIENRGNEFGTGGAGAMTEEEVRAVHGASERARAMQ